MPRRVGAEHGNGHYRLEAFGLWADWNLWRIAHGGLDEPEIVSRRSRHRIYADDFGDRESRALAERLFPGLAVQPLRRSDAEARAL